MLQHPSVSLERAIADRKLILLFYKELEKDKFFKHDRYLKRAVRPIYNLTHTRQKKTGFGVSCVDGPRLARENVTCRTEVACSHVSGLLVQPGWTAGPDGVREPSPHHSSGIDVPMKRQVWLGCVGSTDCAITRHCSLASSSTGAVAYYAATALGWYSFWRSITAQAIRAVLFASATATTSGGRRRRSPITHGSALVAFDRSRLALAPLISSRRRYGLPRLVMPPRRCLPPVEFCRGTRPSQAANSRPLRKPLGSTTVAAMAVAMIGPMPGTLARRWLTGLLLCQAMSCFSIAATAASSCSICAASTCSTWRAKSGSRASPSSRTMAISLPTLRKPCGAITP